MTARFIHLTEKDLARFWSKVALPDENGCMLWTDHCMHCTGWTGRRAKVATGVTDAVGRPSKRVPE